LGEGAADKRAPPRGVAAAAQPPAQSAREGGGWAARWTQSGGRGGWATEPAHEGRGPADVAGPRAWLGHAPGWAARGEVGKRKKEKVFSFKI
jgi:hypothetical protein